MAELSPPPIQSKPEVHLWWLTALFIAINIGLFLWQVLTGVNITSPSLVDAIHWGADYAPLTFLEEPTRLFTSMFFHFGLIHLMLNMWALYIFGSVAEQLFGRFYYLGLYVLAGLMGSLLSGFIDIQNTFELLQTNDPKLFPTVSAGASGAVMGLGGALTVLSLLPILPKQRFILDKKTLVMVMGINLFIGFTMPGINNAAHIGGMLMGAVLAAIWYVGQRIHKPRLGFILGLGVGVVTCSVFYDYCMQQVQILEPVWRQILATMRAQLQF
ncbi:rhomboid family intramembrane serine protease [Acinetobacter sp. ANC 5414]|uniref:rhomboid family intramembrane serine protease n=1 Tax=Acinetobacter sp. ANC 5414 TaxID=2731251 RepID=UPI0014905350|nr:rhomboid family intramembrane serine protease [Acinetobacter sp. ANC 5414]NNH00948.1 rhomboid family intramembrane serine protease [Acinetobacter sp. ANC 5414]